MKALVLCEESGIWSSELHRAGFDVVQVDLELAKGTRLVEPGWAQVGGDLREFVGYRCDVCCAFPPCTDLAASGAVHWSGKDVYPALALASCAASIAYGARHSGLVENPRGLLQRVLGRPSMVVDPWEYAFDGSENFNKRTCLWLHRWPFPFATWAGSENRRSFVDRLPDGKLRAWRRSQSWRGMARAFVNSLLTMKNIFLC